MWSLPVGELLVDRGPRAWFARRLPYHFDPEREQFCFKGVDPETLSQHTRRRAVEVHMYVCADLLLLPLPHLRFFSPVDWREAGEKMADMRCLYETTHSRRYFYWDVDAGGYTPPGTPASELWIRSTILTPDLEELVAHELRHCWQRAQGTAFEDSIEAERDAYPYGCQMGLKFLKEKGEATPEVRAKLRFKSESVEGNLIAEPFRHASTEWRMRERESRRRLR